MVLVCTRSGLRPRQLLAGGSLKDGVSVAEGQDLLQDKCTVPKAEGLTKKELKRLEKKQRYGLSIHLCSVATCPSLET